MNLKLTLLTCILCLTFSSKAQDSDYEVNRAMSDYYNVLKSEGYAPSYDGDNDDIKFKVEGKTYWLNRQGYKSQFALVRYITNDDGCSSNMYKSLNSATKETRYANATISDDCETIYISSYLYNNGEHVGKLVTVGISGIKYCSKMLLEHLE